MNPFAVQVAGAAGEGRFDDVLIFLGRLTGQIVDGNTVIKLRSVQRAAFAAWARKQNVPLQMSLLTAGGCTVSELIGTSTKEPQSDRRSKNTIANVTPAASDGFGSVGQIGIDLEEVESLPQTSDYREDAFFQDHFTPSEMAYCIRQANPRITFCGLWAAKEAIVKAGVIPASAYRMNDFEISHDESGRPTFANCRLSITHTSNFAAAVCIAIDDQGSKTSEIEMAVAPETSHEFEPVHAKRKRWPWAR